MTTQDILSIFKSSGALLDGHFCLTSGLHSPNYFQCSKVLQYPIYAEQLCQEIANHFSDKKISLVISPAVGGIVVGQEVGRLLGVRTIFAERENGEMKLRRGFEVFPDDRVLICEDVITTGGSVREVYHLLDNLHISVIGISSIVDRSNGKAQFAVPYFSLLKMDVESYQPDDCPLCAKGNPVHKPGSRGLTK